MNCIALDCTNLKLTAARQSKCLTDALFEKNQLAENLRQANARIVELTVELAKYKPPEPRYAVGQVLMLLVGDATRVTPVAVQQRTYMEYPEAQKGWWYTSAYSGQRYKESDLRILTPEERGL